MSHPLDQRDIERLEADLALTRLERDQHKQHYDEVLAQMKGGAGAKAALRASDNARRQLSKELQSWEAAYAANAARLIDVQRELAELREELRRDEARAEEVIGELNEQLIRALRRECGATCRTTAERLTELENAIAWGTECLSCSRVLDACHEAEHKASDSAELAKATREKLREAHSDVFRLAAHIRECEQQLKDAHSRLARYEVWDDSVPPGGYVCAACGVPVESEPCPVHCRLPSDPPVEERCERCFGRNPVWCAPSPLWNEVLRGGDINGPEGHAFVCPTCFAELAEEKGIASLWRFYAKRVNRPLQMVTPSGRVWNEKTWLFDEPQCVGCATETFDGAPGSVKLNADATCPVHGEHVELWE